MNFLSKVASAVKSFIIKPSKVKRTDEFDLTSSLELYKEFIDKKYYESSDHTIPAEFVARCVKQNAIWLVNLLMSIAFYAIKFDDSTKDYFSPELLEKSGYKDPCVVNGLVKKAWSQRTSAGKSPIDPKYESELSGLGIANYDASGLKDFYTAKVLSASLPKRDENNEYVFNSNGSIVTEEKEIKYKGKSIRGWGLDYGKNSLSLDNVLWNPDIASIKTNEDGIKYLYYKKPNSLSIKCVGASSSSKNLPSSDRKIWYDWSRYFISGDGSKNEYNIVFQAAKWFCSYWAPYYAWAKNKQLHSIDQIMMLSAIANSTPALANKNIESSVNQMANAYATDSHRKRRIYNTYRAIAIVKYLQSIKY